MTHEELIQLECIYQQLDNAYHNGDKCNMRILFDNFTKHFPQYDLSKQSNIFEVFKENGESPGLPCSIYLIDGLKLQYYIEGCLRTIWVILEFNKRL